MAPSPVEREIFDRRRGAIVEWLKPASPKALDTILALVLGVMRPEVDMGDAAMRRAAYVMGLEDLPAYAVEAACKAALQGKIGDPRFLPKPGELARYGRTYIKPLEDERKDLTRILEAEVEQPPKQTDADRSAMLARIRASVQKVHEGNARTFAYERKSAIEGTPRRPAQDIRSEGSRRAEAQQNLDVMNYKDDPISLSDEAVTKLKR